eukprot:CAMPEP_0179942404 /NCGR_PEP_ID=MMETSP0983-20121128/17601_1 /TAXON_ID=483367 /ORGANISM="non described non described, Strain CCMP 2436" /LENGTH=172 /DNA_ID=CAMNT_0021849709 /DNA_START=49 /DNA_END=568 /DNA_ORIENTATION=+
MAASIGLGLRLGGLARLLPRGAPAPFGGALSSLLSWLPLELGAFLFAVPKKRVSKSRIRIRRAGQLMQRGPQLVTHSYMCPTCNHEKLPHRVCGRPDCSTLHKGHRRAEPDPASALPIGGDAAAGSGLAPDEGKRELSCSFGDRTTRRPAGAWTAARDMLDHRFNTPGSRFD